MRNFYLIILIFLVVTVGCKKKQSIDTNQTGNNSISFDFTYNGKQWAYQPINFVTDLPDSVFRSWDYGDSTPIFHLLDHPHTYTKDGTYTVTLTANGKSVSKTITIGFGIERILKYKHWHRTTYYRLHNHYGPPTYLIVLEAPQGFETKDVDFQLSYQIPYSITFPGNDSTTSGVISMLEMNLDKITDSEWIFRRNSMDPSAGENTCSLFLAKDYVQISRFEYYFPDSGGNGYYYATYTSY